MHRWLSIALLLLVVGGGVYVVTRPAAAPPAVPTSVQLDPPPRIDLISTPKALRHGGSSLVVYRVTPPEGQSGVRIGDVEYRGFPVRGAAASGADAGIRAAFFALLPDQDLQTPAVLFARRTESDESRTPIADERVATPFRQTRVVVDERYFARTLPPIFEQAPQIRVRRSIDNPNDPLADFLNVNGPFRGVTRDQLAQLAAGTSAERLWDAPFMRLRNTPGDAAFGDSVSFVYQARTVDEQRHLGFNLRMLAGGPVVAVNAGTVMSVGWLGIYGNVVIVDHGMGVASLYAHLSSADVKAGDLVVKGGAVGRAGSTGLVESDQLQFAMLVGGYAVNPTEWWDAGWVDATVERELRAAGEAGRSATTQP